MLDARTARQRSVRELTAAGRTVSQIADQLRISPSTVRRDLTARSTDPEEPLPKVSKRQKVVADSPYRGFTPTPFVVLQPPTADQQAWTKLDLSGETLRNLDPAKLYDILRTVSPDVSRAVWDYLRLLDPGHEITVFRPGTERPYPEGQAKLNAFTGTLKQRYGSMKVITGRLFMGALTRGALFAELVLDDAGRNPVDLVVPDPLSVRFRQADDPELGTRWEMVQWQAKEGWKNIERETVVYIPIDPAPASPYGIAPIAPAVFPALFLIGLLGDIRRVIAQQGYPRTDLEIQLDGILKMLGPNPTMDKIKKATREILNEVMAEYAGLEPDDAYGHTDAVKVNMAPGAIDASSLRGVEPVIAALERMLVKALKTMPLMMGATDNTSEANANRQWEIYAAGIKSLQQLAEALLERLFTLALQVQGVAATVRVRFAELRAAEELRDELTLAQKLGNAENMERLGFVDHDEASQHAVGHKATGTVSTAPSKAEAPATGTPAGETPEPLNNAASAKRAKSAVEKVEPADADEPLPPLPDPEISDDDIDRALDTWDTAIPDYAGLLDADVINDDEGSDNELDADEDGE